MKLLYNFPSKSKELQILEALQQRMSLASYDLRTLYRLQKGYKGEKRFHSMLKENVDSDCIVLYDLLLRSNESPFQLDCIIIQQRHIWHLEVKNFEGAYQLQDKSIINLRTNQEVMNPLYQLERATFLLKQLLGKLNYKVSIKSSVVFVHPEFTLYQQQPNFPIVHPTGINRFIKTINKNPSTLSSAHYQLAHKLFASHISDKPDERLPKYEIEQLRNGIRCLRCQGFLAVKEGAASCSECGYIESIEAAVVRSAIEFSYLFPEVEITTKSIWEWCHINRSKKTIRNILNKHMISTMEKRHRYFAFPSRNNISSGSSEK